MYERTTVYAPIWTTNQIGGKGKENNFSFKEKKNFSFKREKKITCGPVNNDEYLKVLGIRFTLF